MNRWFEAHNHADMSPEDDDDDVRARQALGCVARARLTRRTLASAVSNARTTAYVLNLLSCNKSSAAIHGCADATHALNYWYALLDVN